MDNKFQVYYYRHTLGYAEDKKDFEACVRFINFLDSYGGYAQRIAHDGNFYYNRQIDYETGTDYWLNHLGERVDLEQEIANWS